MRAGWVSKISWQRGGAALDPKKPVANDTAVAAESKGAAKDDAAADKELGPRPAKGAVDFLVSKTK